MKATCKAAALVAASVMVRSACAGITNTVDAVALGALEEVSGDSTIVSPDGWTLTDLTAYSDKYDSALKFDSERDVLLSPVYSTSIKRLEVRLFSSSDQGRRLVVTPVKNGVEASDLSKKLDYSGDYKKTTQVISWSGADRVRQFRFNLDDGGKKTGWGLLEITVIRSDPLPFVIRLR